MKTPSNVRLKRAKVDNATLERGQATLPNLQITVRPLGFSHTLYRGDEPPASASITTSKVPALSLRLPSFTPRNNTPSRWATKSRRVPIRRKSSLSSPITAIKAPVASLRISFSLSTDPGNPAGVENRPPPRETRPVELIRKRCPLRTTKPLFVQPLFALSARTATLIVKHVGEPDA